MESPTEWHEMDEQAVLLSPIFFAFLFQKRASIRKKRHKKDICDHCSFPHEMIPCKRAGARQAWAPRGWVGEAEISLPWYAVLGRASITGVERTSSLAQKGGVLRSLEYFMGDFSKAALRDPICDGTIVRPKVHAYPQGRHALHVP